jgi:hypothetical protein
MTISVGHGRNKGPEEVQCLSTQEVHRPTRLEQHLGRHGHASANDRGTDTVDDLPLTFRRLRLGGAQGKGMLKPLHRLVLV